MSTYRSLDADHIVGTIEILKLRIEERFPGRGLGKVCGTLIDVAKFSSTEAQVLAKPNLLLRTLIAGIVIAGAIVFIYVGTFLNFSKITTEAFGLVQGLEAAINTLLLSGLGIAFLVTAEERLKRRRALKDLHELRSIIHVIDMHQLTKDPSALLGDSTRTEHSPKRPFTRFELMRYLDYCSEMLSLSGKVAALYADHFPDQVIVEAVNDLENISTALSRKIWQKIMILHRFEDEAVGKSEV